MLEPVFQGSTSHGCKMAAWIPAIIAMIMVGKKEERYKRNCCLSGKESIPRNAYQVFPYILLARTKFYSHPKLQRGQRKRARHTVSLKKNLSSAIKKQYENGSNWQLKISATMTCQAQFPEASNLVSVCPNLNHCPTQGNEGTWW